MRAYVAAPDGGGVSPAVVVIHHGWGVDEVIESVVDRLANVAYVAIAPDLFHRQEPRDEDVMKRIGALRDAEVVSDIRSSLAHLGALPGRRIGRTGIVGFCMGGRVSYLAAGSNLGLQAAAVFYGGDIAIPWHAAVSPLDLTPNVGCPLIGFFGDEDTNPSPADVQRIDETLRNFSKPHEFYRYPGAGHAFMNFRMPARYREAAAADAWPKLVAFFDTNLKSVAGVPERPRGRT
jgi:carboxymethylenebutenolidase